MLNAVMTFSTGPSVRAWRRSLGLSQMEFWSPLGVAQSWASRYEAAERLPKPIQLLLEISYGTDASAEALMAELRDIPKVLSADRLPIEAKRKAPLRNGRGLADFAPGQDCCAATDAVRW